MGFEGRRYDFFELAFFKFALSAIRYHPSDAPDSEPAKSCGMKHHLKFDLEKCYTSSSVAQLDAWSANLDILSLQREHLSFPSLLSLILE
jgi:hypothetical protein